MIVICHSNYPILNKNGNMLKDVGDVSVKDFLAQMTELKRYAWEHGISLKTSSEANLEDAHAVLFIDMPSSDSTFYKRAIQSRKPLFLWAWESGIINTRNSNKELHNKFRIVFTHDDSFLENSKYIKVAYAFHFPNSVKKKYHNKKLCCVIAGNKASSHPLELYSHRLAAIKWFEQHHIEDFDLYGQGWNKIIPPKTIIDRIKNKVNWPITSGENFRPSYKGPVLNKVKIYERYRFSICYENARDLPGYVSEKIFDCFFSGCVPIYWGAPNIGAFIPNDCYLDRREFSSMETLYERIRKMSEDEYMARQEAIEAFVLEGQHSIFGAKRFATTVIDTIRRYF